MARRPRILILDDDCEGSALQRAKELEFLTDFHLKGISLAADADLAKQAEAMGYEVILAGPGDVLGSTGEEWENTLFLVDVSWSEFGARYPELATLSMEARHVFGIVLCEHVLQRRQGNRGVFLNFYSNSAIGEVSTYVQLWHREGRHGIAAVIGGQMIDGRPAMQVYCLAQVWEIARRILGRAGAETLRELHAAMNRWNGRGPESLEDFLGGAIVHHVDGWSLVDVVYPLFAEYEYARANPRREAAATEVLNCWRAALPPPPPPLEPTEHSLSFELPGDPCNLPVLLLTQLVRYGSVDFLDAFLYFRTGTVDCGKFLDPLKVVGDEPSRAWIKAFSFRQRLSDIVQRSWTIQLRPKPGATQPPFFVGWPPELRDPPAFDFVRDGQVRAATLMVDGANGRYHLQVQEKANVSNRLLEAAQIVQRCVPGSPYDDQLRRAYELDPGSLLVLEAVATRISSVIESTGRAPANLESLRDSLRDALSNVKVAIDHVARLELLLAGAVSHPVIEKRQQSRLKARLETDWRGTEFNARAKIVRWRSFQGAFESALEVLQALLPEKETLHDQCERLLSTVSAADHEALFESVFRALCEHAQGRAITRLRHRFPRKESVIMDLATDYWPTMRRGRLFWQGTLVRVLPKLKPDLHRLSDTQLQLRLVRSLVADFMSFVGEELSLDSLEMAAEVADYPDDGVLKEARRILAALSPGALPTRKLVEAVIHLCEQFAEKEEDFYEKYFSRRDHEGRIILARQAADELWELLNADPCRADLTRGAFLARVSYQD